MGRIGKSFLSCFALRYLCTDGFTNAKTAGIIWPWIWVQGIFSLRRTAYGMVALNKKGDLNEVIIQCSDDNTSKLRESLINTKFINWNNVIII
ncbi:unnamed protein product [Diatraea saccharalis]|uniref:Uncharacterized protein n=1 Tax=Diatraea saccharalis TaxID=40085 RepID=A0A9N9WLF8_9NEOP|nr:unnamed protein product [Diatraea saccharalis]